MAAPFLRVVAASTDIIMAKPTNTDSSNLTSSRLFPVIKSSPNGLWRTKKHRLFYEELKQVVSDAGYVLSERLINAIQYGVPQDRNRIILFGIHKNFSGVSGLETSNDRRYLSEGVFPWDELIKYPGKEAFKFPWPTVDQFREDSELPFPPEIPEELTVEHWFKKNLVYDHPNSGHQFKPRAGLTRFQSIDEGDDSKKSFKRLHRWRYSPAASYGNNEVHLHPYKPRRISVSEALSIQSIPKNFVFPDTMSLSNMFKATGNGVPFLASKEIAKSINTFVGGVV